eukprot:5704783-Pleurochrysis_carterae.AAC.3
MKVRGVLACSTRARRRQTASPRTPERLKQVSRRERQQAKHPLLSSAQLAVRVVGATARDEPYRQLYLIEIKSLPDPILSAPISSAGAGRHQGRQRRTAGGRDGAGCG